MSLSKCSHFSVGNNYSSHHTVIVIMVSHPATEYNLFLPLVPIVSGLSQSPPFLW